MFNIFKSSSSASSAPTFELGREIDLPQADKSIFRLHEGRLKQCRAGQHDAQISVFVCDDPSRLAAASAAVKRLKTLRHPAVLTFVEAVETETKVMVATEAVTPLSRHLDELDRKGVRGAPREQYLAWGVFQVKK